MTRFQTLLLGLVLIDYSKPDNPSLSDAYDEWGTITNGQVKYDYNIFDYHEDSGDNKFIEISIYGLKEVDGSFLIDTDNELLHTAIRL